MADSPRICLVTPPAIRLDDFPDAVGAVLDATDVACVRLELASRDEAHIRRAADVLRETCHARDVALVVTDHVRLVEPHGLDGVHLASSTPSCRAARGELGRDRIVGVFCGNSRHAGMSAGEQGADYVAFGPVTPSELGDGSVADAGLFEWWSEMIEVPVVADGVDTAEDAARLADMRRFPVSRQRHLGGGRPAECGAGYPLGAGEGLTAAFTRPRQTLARRFRSGWSATRSGS